MWNHGLIYQLALKILTTINNFYPNFLLLFPLSLIRITRLNRKTLHE